MALRRSASPAASALMLAAQSASAAQCSAVQPSCAARAGGTWPPGSGFVAISAGSGVPRGRGGMLQSQTHSQSHLQFTIPSSQTTVHSSQWQCTVAVAFAAGAPQPQTREARRAAGTPFRGQWRSRRAAATAAARHGVPHPAPRSAAAPSRPGGGAGRVARTWRTQPQSGDKLGRIGEHRGASGRVGESRENRGESGRILT